MLLWCPTLEINPVNHFIAWGQLKRQCVLKKKG